MIDIIRQPADCSADEGNSGAINIQQKIDPAAMIVESKGVDQRNLEACKDKNSD
jgi:hypothetical protein